MSSSPLVVDGLEKSGKKLPAKKLTNTTSVTSTDPYPNVILDKNIDFTSINEILEKIFKHVSFRTELQRDAVVEACKFEKDLFVSLPTGSGKSLIYQLPALYKNHGLVIVVSPLVALISNQISNAKRLGIPCATINSHMPPTWNSQVKLEISKKDPKLRLIYITPETLCSDHFKHYLNIMKQNKTLKLIAIDEAHCVSSWGHEFRPHYLKLGLLRSYYPDIPIVALTATATKKVLNDILDVLELKEPKHFIASSFRKNLYYDVIDADKLDKGALNDLTEFMRECLKIDKPKEIKKRKVGQVKQKTATSSSGVGSTSSSGSQFVSAATLLTTATTTDTKSKSSSSKTKGVSRKSLSSKNTSSSFILAKETKITSFFKPKPVEVIDLCEDDDDDDDVRIESKESKSAQLLFEQTFGLPPPPPKRNKISSSFACANELTNNNNHRPTVPKKAAGVGIVYCRTKLTCEDVASHLNMKGIPAKPYHSSLTSKQRAEIEQLWMNEKVLVICATISFGMGIDKPNVRAVVHFNMSQSLANYYQESGRAGRDGEQSYCRLYYSQADFSAIMFLLRKDLCMDDSERGTDNNNKHKKAVAQEALNRFDRMVEYSRSGNKCRHLILAKEFALADESKGVLANGCGECCDRCCERIQAKAYKSKKFSDSNIDWASLRDEYDQSPF